MKILGYMSYGILAIVGLFCVSFVCVLLDDALFGDARRRKTREQMFMDIISGKFARPKGPKVGLLAIAVCLSFFGPVRAEARQIDAVIVHHTAGSDVSAATIGLWHKARGFDGIGYHYVIRADGTVEVGRPVNKVGAHANGHNTRSIGIALTGKDSFTWQQKVSLGILVRKLCQQYPVQKIERHHERCPGPGLDVEAMAKDILQTRSQTGQASHFMDWDTASGRHVFPWTVGCASWFYPLGSRLKVTNLKTKKFVVCEVIDRGPRRDLVEQGRVVDLTTAAFARIARTDVGLVDVRVERVL